MRREHYERVVRWDRRARFPEREHKEVVPGVKKVTRRWGRKSQGYEVGRVAAASSARRIVGGQRPKVRYTKTSVASRRLVKGDPVGCSVEVVGKQAYRRREQRIRVGLPEMRPFEGIGGVETVDEQGNVCFQVTQPGVRGVRRSHYEEYEKLVQGTSGRWVIIETGAKTRPVGLARREGRRVPFSE